MAGKISLCSSKKLVRVYYPVRKIFHWNYYKCATNFRRNRSLGSLLTYEGLPESLKKEVLVRSTVEEDPDVLKERQDIVKNMKPAQLGNIGGLSDFPLPDKLDSLMRPSKRNLKSTKKKEETKRR